MKIISGTLGRRQLKVPKHKDFRPTSERTREGLFSTLKSMFQLEGKVVLDLFSGSGALGLEALSRGAYAAVFVEKEKVLAHAIHENVKRLGVEDSTQVYCETVEKFFEKNVQELRRWLRLSLQVADQASSDTSSVFDLVFADPPYQNILSSKELMEFPSFVHRLLDNQWIKPNGVLILETHKGVHLAEDAHSSTGTLSVMRTKVKRYGDTTVRFFVCEEK